MINYLKKTLLFTCLLLLGFSSLAQQRFYVNAAATGQNSGASWADAFNDLHLAMAAAGPGDEVWVAQGVYFTDTNQDRNRRFTLSSGAKLIGGFQGTETTAEQARPQEFPTILNGNIGNPNDSTDNAFTLLYLDRPDEFTLVRGLVFENGYAQSDTSFGNVSPYRAGGAVYIYATNGFAYPVFEHCLFRNNYAGGNGGAVMVRGTGANGAAPLFRYCHFENNTCGNNGGAVWIQGGSDIDKGIDFDHCRFVNNAAGSKPGTQAGGVFYWKVTGTDTLQFFGCHIVSNRATGIAGFLQFDCTVPEKYAHVDSCFISGNYTTGTFGGIAASFINFDGVSNFSNLRNIKIRNNLFYQQKGALNAYMIYTSSGSGFNPANNYTITGNRFEESSGAIAFDNSGYTLFQENTTTDSIRLLIRSKNTIISRNQFTGRGNQCIVSSYESESRLLMENNLWVGDSIFYPLGTAFNNPVRVFFYDTLSKDTIYFINNTFVNGWWYAAPATSPGSKTVVWIRNNLLLNNRHAITQQACLPIGDTNDLLFVDYNAVDFVCEDLQHPTFVCGDHNLLLDSWPFIDTAGADYRLAPCSAATNAGSPLFFSELSIQNDLAEMNRVQGVAPDIGAFESTPPLIQAMYITTPACTQQNSGGFTAFIEGGCPPYTLNWSGPGGGGSHTEQLFPGLYQITITDAISNQLYDSLEIPALDAPSIPPPVITQTSTGVNNGSIFIDPEGGIPPYAVLWSQGDTTNFITNLAAGIYSVTVTDTQGCSFSDTYQVGVVSDSSIPDAPGALRVWPVPASGVLFLNTDVFDRVEIIDTTGRTWPTPRTNTSAVDISGLAAGAYWLKVVQPNGATQWGSFLVQ